MTAILELLDIHKSFPGAHVLKGVSLAAQPGRVHALLGENGAGKSTLIKIASGALAPDVGEIRVAGEPTNLTPHSARSLGIRVLHQERQIALSRTVADNVLIDEPATGRSGLVSARSINREAARRLAAVGVDLDPAALAASLTLAQMQLLELARAVTSQARCIILDEPTASLHRGEVGGLFEVVHRIRDAGVAVIYISHHLDEVQELADDYTVLRDGRPTANGLVADVSTGQLISAMFGTEVSLRREDVIGESGTIGDVALEFDNVSYGSAVRDVNLTVRKGEVVVISGSVGCGSREVARLMAGAISPTAGTVKICGTGARGRRQAVRDGVAFLPANRKADGLMLDRSIVDNVLLAETGIRRGLAMFRQRRALTRTEGACRELSVKMSDARAPIRGLSGGNQQKGILARWMEVGSDVLVLDEPTVGVDIPSKFEIYRMLRQRALQGSAVVVFSTEYQEIRCVADRVIVMRDGRVVGEVDGENADEHTLFTIEMGA